MSGILRLESLTKGNTLKQGDKTPLKYRLFDADGERLDTAGKSAVARLMYPDFLRVGYESEELTVSPDNTVTFSIDKVIQPILYYLEITVDDKYIFPSRNDESKLNIDKSSKGSDVAIIEIIGKDVLVRDIKNMVDSEIEPVVNDMIISNQKVIENEKIVKDVQTLSEELEARQDQVEQFNNQVITEMTDKDVISAPEIILARGGHDTLGARIDYERNQIETKLGQTTMDVITGVIKPDIGEYITTNGFYGFGNTYRYAVLPISGDENFSDSGKGFAISLQGEIKISDKAKIIPVPSDKVSVGALGCNNVNDDKCFQSAYNLAKLRDCNVDVDVNVTIVSGIDIHRGGSDEERRIIEFSGRGIITKTTPLYLFTNTLSRSGGNIKFNGIHFRSEAGAGTVIFHGGYLLRMYFENCHFLNVDRLTNTIDDKDQSNATPWNYLQTLYVDSSTFVGGEGWLIDAHTAYDLSFNHSIVEAREKFIKIGMNHSVRITDNLIEDIEGKVLEVKNGRSLVFDDNYMEHNGTIIEGSSITVDNPSFGWGFNEMMNFSFKNNLYIGTDTQVGSQSYYLMSITNWGKSVSVENNFCDANFLKVTNRQTLAIMPNSLIKLYGNNIANGKNVINDSQSPKYLAIGSGNILSDKFNRPVSLGNYTFFNDSVNTKEIQEQSLIIMQSPVGVSSNKVGFTVGGAILPRLTDYVIGVAASLSDPNKECDGIKVVLRESSSETIVYEDTLDISDAQFSDGYVTFYAMKYFRSPNAKQVFIDVFIEPKSGTFSDAVSQRLAVSNVVLQRGHVATDFIG